MTNAPSNLSKIARKSFTHKFLFYLLAASLALVSPASMLLPTPVALAQDVPADAGEEVVPTQPLRGVTVIDENSRPQPDFVEGEVDAAAAADSLEVAADAQPEVVEASVEEESGFLSEMPVEDGIDPAAGEVSEEADIAVASEPAPLNADPEVAAALANAQAEAMNGASQMYLPLVNGQIGQDEQAGVVAAGSTTYYVNCSGGNDSKSGRSQSDAWKTVSRANKASLAAGDRLLFKRGCSWNGTLEAGWRGTSSSPIIIGAYGSGDLPKIQNGYSVNIRLKGSHTIVEDLHVTLSTPPNPDRGCKYQPRGWKAGISLGGSYNTARRIKATKLTIGVYFSSDSHHNKLLNSTITDNNVVERLTSTAAHGATGVSLHGNYHEIGYNYFANNRTICTYNGIVESNSIELYEASNSSIHHNTSYGDRVFAELGSTSRWRSSNNTFAYNLHVSSYSHSSMGTRFVVTRGYGHQFGPVLNTRVLNNVTYHTGGGSKPVTCGECGRDILTMRNNILWANGEPFVSDAPFNESHNIFWSSDGTPMLRWHGFSMSSSSRIANPKFVNPGSNNFRLQSSSPAINRGTLDIVNLGYKWDLANKAVPSGGAVDVGSYEY